MIVSRCRRNMAPYVSERLSRRALLAGAGFVLSGSAAQSKLKVAIFSKHLQFVQGDDLARTAAEIGFDAIDITVRKGGHVEPERVGPELPGLVATIRKHGLEVPMSTTDIVDTSSPMPKTFCERWRTWEFAITG